MTRQMGDPFLRERKPIAKLHGSKLSALRPPQRVRGSFLDPESLEILSAKMTPARAKKEALVSTSDKHGPEKRREIGRLSRNTPD